MNQYNTSVELGQSGVENGPHSGLGIASFVTSIVGSVGMVATFVAAGVMETSTPGGIDEESTGVMLIGFAMLALALMLLISGILGITSLFQTSRKKLFGILGISFSVGFIAIFIALVVIGTLMG